MNHKGLKEPALRARFNDLFVRITGDDAWQSTNHGRR